MENSLKDLIYLFVYIIGFFEMLWLASKAKNAPEAVCRGWLLALIITIPIAIWELTTDNHLSYAYQETGMMMNYGHGYTYERKFASIAFGNLNGYNTFLCLTLPFLFVALSSFSGKRKLFYWGALAMLAIIVIANSSRAAILTLGFGFCLYLWFNLLEKGLKSWFFSSLFVVMTVISIFIFVPDIFESITSRFMVQGLGDEYRVDLLRCGWDALENSAFMGIGIGNFVPLMDWNYRLEILPPHNLWLEIAAQFGIIIFGLFMGLIVRQWIFCRRGTKINRRAFWLCILLLVPTSIINSGYLTQSYTWVFLASFCILSNPKFNPVHDEHL